MTHMQTLKPAIEATMFLDDEVGSFINAMSGREETVGAPALNRRLRRTSRRRRG